MKAKICVFCSANDVDEKYVKAASDFAKYFALHGYDLVWGGTNHGLMKVVADGVSEGGGKLFGVSTELLKEKVRLQADEMVIAKDLGTRKAMMLERADALVVLVGGVGTLDEVMSVIELKKHKVHEKPVVILNTDNFFEGLKIQFEKMEKEGFIGRKLEDLVYFADTPDQAIQFINRALKGKN